MLAWKGPLPRLTDSNQEPTFRLCTRPRKVVITLKAVILPVPGLDSEGIFSMVISKRALSESTLMVWVLRVLVGSAQISSWVFRAPIPARPTAATKTKNPIATAARLRVARRPQNDLRDPHAERQSLPSPQSENPCNPWFPKTCSHPVTLSPIPNTQKRHNPAHFRALGPWRSRRSRQIQFSLLKS